MSLSGLLPLLYDQPSYANVARQVGEGESVWIETLSDPARAFILSALHADVTAPRGRPIIVVTPRAYRARQLYEGLLAYSPPGTPVYLFPAPDLLPYERIAPDPTIVGERLRVLASLRGAGVRGSGIGGRESDGDEGQRIEDGGRDSDPRSPASGPQPPPPRTPPPPALH